MPATPCTHAALEAALGHVFADADLLKTALTPTSSGHRPDNQRLEFLGDAILQFCSARLVFQAHPDWAEGDLSKLRGLLVCTEALREWAEALALPLRRGPRSPKHNAPGGQRKPLADAMEALLAAMYLDAEAQGRDGMATVMRLIDHRFGSFLREATPTAWAQRDPKTTLQEKAAQLGLPAPLYTELARTGPDHSPHFRQRVMVGSEVAEGQGRTLKSAQADAARRLLSQIMGEPPASLA